MGMKSEEEAVALQAIEFWTSVAEEETNIESHYLDGQEVRGKLCIPGSRDLAYLSRVFLMEILTLPGILRRLLCQRLSLYYSNSSLAKTRTLRKANGTFQWLRG